MSQRTTSTTTGYLIEVQKKLYGQRSQNLTPTEINRLFQEPITPEFNLVLYRALASNAISPDVAILQAIPRAKTSVYLIPIALCLRYGVDANMYVNAPQLGTIHILGYVYSTLAGDQNDDTINIDVLNTIIIMLVAKGSRPTLPMYDSKAGRIRTENDSPTSSLSVIDWLHDQGYQTILDRVNIGDSSELQKVIDPNSLAIISILLDMTSLMGREYQASDMLLAIRAFSDVSFDKIPTPDTMIGMEYKSLNDAVTYLNSSAYDKLLKRGQMPGYLLINRILVNMTSYRNAGRIAAAQELQRMLVSSISMGTQLDQDQLSIVRSMGTDVITTINKEYEQPYWRKICRAPSNAPPPPALRRLAISLNIDPTLSKAAICDSISNLSRADKEALKEASRRRQQLRMSSDLGTITEFMGGKVPNLICRNKGLLPHDPLDYIDIDIAYYRDDQGAVWCFSSDQFSSILESGVNPYNHTVLPQSFKEQLQYQINVLKRLGIDAGRGEIGIYSSKVPVTFSQAIDNLSAKDTISERGSEQSLELFTQLASNNGISIETVRRLTKEQMINALRSVGYDVDLNSLSTSHAQVTTARIVEFLNNTNPDAIPVFFSSINQMAII